MEKFADAVEKGCPVKLALSAFLCATSLAMVTASPATARDNNYTILDSSEKRLFTEIYAAIDGKDWDRVENLLAEAPEGPMTAMATSEYFLAGGSPTISAERLEKLLSEAPYLPRAEQIERLAQKRGVTRLPERPGIQRLSYLGGAPRRDLPRNVAGTDISEIRDLIQINIRNDDPAGAEKIVEENAANLPDDALTELRYRVAWSYYIENDDMNARKTADIARKGSGDWAVQASWAYGMANWRMKNYAAAYEGFDIVGRRAANDDLRAAGLFWGARSAVALRRPDLVQARLQNAAALPESFYGLIAREALGIDTPLPIEEGQQDPDWRALRSRENIRIAVALKEIGQDERAGEVLKFQARIGDPRQYEDIVRLAGAIGLPSTQYWLGHYGPGRMMTHMAARYPMPDWKPQGGWRVDPSLVYAHALQESNFRTDAVSGAGAHGLLQVRPGTAREFAAKRGEVVDNESLKQPSVNLEYGQSYIEKLRDLPLTGGLLPKVIAAYNAGPSPVARWNMEVRDNGDPLLYIESVPYWETRAYIGIILRNYWMYELQSGHNGGSLTGIAQYLWPAFPNQNGKSIAVRSSGGKTSGGR